MDSVGGVMFAKFLNLFRKEKINPMVGAAGISAFPMSSRVIQKMATEEDPGNFILMQAAGANVAVRSHRWSQAAWCWACCSKKGSVRFDVYRYERP